MSRYGIAITSPRPFGEVMASVKEALASQGFGIVAEIDMQATMKNKLGVEIPATTILGACNPPAAKHALEVEPSIGLLLPCNVVVRESEGQTIVEAINTEIMVDMTSNAELSELSADVGKRLQAALDLVAAA